MEDGEVEYGGSTKNKNNAFFDIKYMIRKLLLKETIMRSKK